MMWWYHSNKALILTFLFVVFVGICMLSFAMSLPDNLADYYHCRDVIFPECVGDDLDLRAGGIYDYENNTWINICSCFNMSSGEFVDEIVW